MSESLNDEIKVPEMKFITVEIKRTKIDDNGQIYEVVEEEEIPEFLADILSGDGNIFV